MKHVNLIFYYIFLFSYCRIFIPIHKQQNFIWHYHHHQITLIALRFLNLSRYPYLSPITLGSLLGCILCPHRDDVCKSLVVYQHWHVHLLEFILERCLWVCHWFSCTSCSSYLNSLWDGRQVAVELLFCRVLLPGFLQDIMKNFCVVPR